MIKKTYMVIPFLAFCLTATLFIATVTSGKKDNPWDVISELQTKVDSLNASLLELQSRVETLEGQLPQQGFLTAPAYDSGGMPFAMGTTIIYHGLGTAEVLVYMIGNETENWRINQIAYGGLQRVSIMHGAHWDSLTEDSMRIYRQLEDPYWDQVRVMIWKISEP